MGTRLAQLAKRSRAACLSPAVPRRGMLRTEQPATPAPPPVPPVPIERPQSTSSARTILWSLPFGTVVHARSSVPTPRPWSLGDDGNYAEASPAQSLGAPKTFNLIDEEDHGSIPIEGPEKVAAVTVPPALHEDIANIGSDEASAAMPAIDEAWNSRLKQVQPQTGSEAEQQSVATEQSVRTGAHAIFDRMGRSHAQMLSYPMGRFDIDEHLTALETAIALDHKISAGGSPDLSSEAGVMDDFDLLSEIASLMSEAPQPLAEDHNADEAEGEPESPVAAQPPLDAAAAIEQSTKAAETTPVFALEQTDHAVAVTEEPEEGTKPSEAPPMAAPPTPPTNAENEHGHQTEIA